MNLLAPDKPMMQKAPMQEQAPQGQMPQEQAGPKRGSSAERIANDPQSQEIAASIQAEMADVQDVILQKLSDGKGDIKKEIAETAGNLLKSGAEGQKLTFGTLENTAKQVIGWVVTMAVEAGLVPQDQLKAMVPDLLPLTLYIYQNGPGSIE